MRFGNFEESKWKLWVIKFKVMGNNSFLENLKNAVETGEFNSDAANRIKQINELADNAKGFTEEDGENARKLLEAQAVTEEEAVELNSSYEKEMEKIKMTDLMNKQLATLIEIEEMVNASIDDMVEFTNENLVNFEKEFEEKNPIFTPLKEKIEEVRKKYSTYINK